MVGFVMLTTRELNSEMLIERGRGMLESSD